MAGFAINVDLIVRNEDAVLGQMSNDGECSMLETCFLEQFTTRETVECIGGKEVYIMISIMQNFSPSALNGKIFLLCKINNNY